MKTILNHKKKIVLLLTTIVVYVLSSLQLGEFNLIQWTEPQQAFAVLSAVLLNLFVIGSIWIGEFEQELQTLEDYFK